LQATEPLIVSPVSATATGDFAAVMESVKAMIEEKGFGGEFTLFRMIEALPDGITKEEADALILSHRSSAPVYQERVTFTVFAD